MVPPVPPVAESTVASQKVPAPLTATVVGKAFTVKLAVLPDPGTVLQELAFCTLVIVTVVAPALPKELEGILNEPAPPDMVTDAVAPLAELAPERL